MSGVLRSEPDSGNPTVRDRRAALRTVTSTAGGVLVRALNFEPDNRTHGSTGGDWKRKRYGVTAPAPTQPPSPPLSVRWNRAQVLCEALTRLPGRIARTPRGALWTLPCNKRPTEENDCIAIGLRGVRTFTA